MNEEMIPIVMFISVAIVLIAVFWFRYRSRDGVQQTIRIALDKGNELSPDLIERLGHPKPPKNKDKRLAVMWLALAAGWSMFAFAIPDEEAVKILLGIAAFPFTIGIAYLIMSKFADRG